MEDSNTITLKIRKYRKEQNMSQDELAEKSGINVSTIKKYETGYRNPKLDQLLKISTALGVSINEFMDFEISTISDVISLLMRLDEQTNMQITGKKDKDGNYIPDSISITFTDNKINDALAAYLSYKDKKKAIDIPISAKDMTVTSDDLTITLEHTRNKLLISPENINK